VDGSNYWTNATGTNQKYIHLLNASAVTDVINGLLLEA
jgi:hypothetical protein